MNSVSMERPVLWGTLIAVAVIAVVLIILMKYVRPSQKKKLPPAETGQPAQLPEQPVLKSGRLMKLKEEYLREWKVLESQKRKLCYSVLFEKITPQIQRLLGYCRYNLDENIPPKQMQSELELLFVNLLDSCIVNAGFHLEGGRFLYVRQTDGGNEFEKIQQRLDGRYTEDSQCGELEQRIQELKQETDSLTSYTQRERVCKEAAGPLSSFREMVKGGRVERGALAKQCAALAKAYGAAGLEFRYYEDAALSKEDRREFLLGSEGAQDYPAVFQKGKIYANLAGRRLREKE